MKTFLFWYRWLLCVSMLIILFGVLLVFDLGMSIIDSLFDPLFWPSEELSQGTERFQRWIYSILGATMIGWGGMLYGITKNGIAKKEKWARDTILWSLCVWCIVDSTASITLGASVNILFNMVFLILVTLPLLMTFKEYHNRESL